MVDSGNRRLAAVFFSDICGYSRQMDADETAALARLDIHNALMEEQIARRGGRVIKTVGDAYMAEFPSAAEAVAAALDALRALARHNAGVEESERITVRIGVHAGDVIERSGDLFGETVNQAARLEAKAPPGGLCVSAAVYEQVREKIHATGEDLGEVQLKGIEEPVRVFVLRPSGEHLEIGKASLPPPRQLKTRAGWATPGRIALIVAAGVGLVYLKTREPPPERRAAPSTSSLASEPSARSVEVPRRGGTLHIASQRQRGAFDYFFVSASLSSLAIDLTNDTLFRRAEDGSVVPGAVDRWRSLEGGRVMELHLRDGSYFHDHPCLPGGKGRPADGEDLRASLALAATHGALPAPMLTDSTGDAGRSLRPARVVDGNTLRVELGQSVAEPEKMLYRIYLLPRELDGCRNVRKVGWPVGTGPFRFAHSPDGDVLQLVRWERSWEREGEQRLPYVDAIELRSIGDSVDAVRRIDAGELDIYEGSLAASDPAIEVRDELPALRPRLATAKASVALSVQPNVTMLVALIFLPRQRRAPGSLAVRQAIASALDPSELARVAHVPVRPLGRFLEPRLRGYDAALPAVAKRLPDAERILASSGHAHGKGLAELTLGASEQDFPVAEKVRDSLAEIGLRVRLVEGSNVPALDELDIDMLLTHLVVGTFGGELAFSRLIGVFDNWGPADPELAKLLMELQAAAERQERAAVCTRIERRLLEVLPAIPIGTLSPTSAATFSLQGPRVRGFADGTTARVLPSPGAPYARVYLTPP